MDLRDSVLAAATLTVVAVTLRLGWWQLDRAAERQALHDALQARMSQPALELSGLASTVSQAEQQHFRAILLEGRWLAAHTIFLDNRVQSDRNGMLVVTPLALPDGSAVVVLRGWVAHDPMQRSSVPRLALPSGEPVRLEGRIVPPPSRYFEMAADTPGPIRQNLDLAGYAAKLVNHQNFLAVTGACLMLRTELGATSTDDITALPPELPRQQPALAPQPGRQGGRRRPASRQPARMLRGRRRWRLRKSFRRVRRGFP